LHVSPVSTPVEFNSVNNSAILSLFADVWDHTPPPAVLVSVPHVGLGLLVGGAEACCEVVGTGDRDMGLYPNKLSEETHGDAWYWRAGKRQIPGRAPVYVFLGTRTIASTRVDDDERGRVDRELDAGDEIAIVDGSGRIRDK
jgi:hypothetical protein